MVENAELGVRRLCPFRRDGTLGPGERSPVEDERIEQRQPEARAHEGEQEQEGLEALTAGATHGREATSPAYRAGSPWLARDPWVPPKCLTSGRWGSTLDLPASH